MDDNFVGMDMIYEHIHELEIDAIEYGEAIKGPSTVSTIPLNNAIIRKCGLDPEKYKIQWATNKRGAYIIKRLECDNESV